MILDFIKLEYLKYKKNSVVTMLVGFYFLFFPFVIFFGQELKVNLPDFIPNKNVFFEFPTVWDYFGYAGSWLVFFFLGVSVIYMTCMEVTNKTMRQSILNGFSRKDFFISKFSSAVIIAIAATIYFALISLLVGYLNTENLMFEDVFDNQYAITRYFLMCMGYFCFALFLAFIIRKSGLAIFLYLSYIMIIEPLIRWAGHMYMFKHESAMWYPMNAVEDLIPMPLWRFSEALPEQDIPFDFLLTYKFAGGLTILFSSLFIFIAYRSFSRRDI